MLFDKHKLDNADVNSYMVDFVVESRLKIWFLSVCVIVSTSLSASSLKVRVECHLLCIERAVTLLLGTRYFHNVLPFLPELISA